MSAKRALIVDDSRSARAFLTRILERYDLQVDGAESAAEAIEYLNRQRPDVIFLDHLMPGMDGFQALSVIKNDPRTATIPVMMYTSQEGELYLSQARALGAMGVLPKQTQPADVSRALEQLRLLGEHIPESEIATVRVPSLHEPTAAAQGGDDARATRLLPAAAAGAQAAAGAASSGGLTPEMRAQLDSLLHDHGIELRRFVTHSLQLHAERIVGDVRALMDEAMGQAGAAAASVPEPAPSLSPPRRGSAAALWLSAAAAVIAVIAGVLWYRAANQERQLAAQPAAAGNAPGVGADNVAVSGYAAAPAHAALNGASRSATARAAALLVEAVPFGESPFAGARIEPIQALLERLGASGFRGTVEIRSYPGRFCMQGSGDGAVLPAADTSYAKCDQVGNPVDGSGNAARESVAFANMLAAQHSRSGGGFEVQLLAGSADDLIAPYPPISEPLTAGEWNRAAAANNRVEVRARALP